MNVKNALPDDVLLEFTDAKFRQPTIDEIELAISLCLRSDGVKYSNKQISDLVGVNPRTIRRWLCVDPEGFREIPYAAWRLLLITAGLVELKKSAERL